MTTTIWWIRRDLRLADNAALREAAARGGTVIPLFILDPALQSRSRFHARALARQAFLFEGLRSLDSDLRARGSRLIVREGRPLEVLSQLMAESGASLITAEEDYSPYALRRDAAIAQALPLRLVAGLTLRPPGLVRKADGKPYTVFTPFSKAWRAFPMPSASDIIAPPASLAAPPAPLHSLALPAPQSKTPHFPAAEAEARRRLEHFTRGDRAPIYDYAEGRNALDLEGTSALSPYFRFGLLSARQAVVAALQAAESAPTASARKGVEAWVNELIWREFYISILYHFPHVLDTALNPALRSIPWREAPHDLQAWQEGRTGCPVVDAAMRQLLATGWMHNRARMITASFLTKDLLINWQEGERWFMQHLIDGDPAANNGGWQWTAGVGADAAPYFRIFNPVLQSQKFDPQGRFIRRYLPELASVPHKYIHQPWLMPAETQRACGVIIGEHYPTPIVDRAVVKARTLAAYRTSSGGGRAG